MKWRACSVPFHHLFQETSTRVMNRSPSTSHAKHGGFPANRIARVVRMIDPTTAEAF
ncbi:MAG: hypothetical protein ACJ8KA_00125 [Sulfurifustis sp.]